jgi:hypothetical protein
MYHPDKLPMVSMRNGTGVLIVGVVLDLSRSVGVSVGVLVGVSIWVSALWRVGRRQRGC